MNEWGPTEAVRPETWGAFMEYARGFGVVLKREAVQSFDGGEHDLLEVLERTDGDRVLRYPLPENAWDPHRTMRWLRVRRVCNQLEIPRPNWPIAF